MHYFYYNYYQSNHSYSKNLANNWGYSLNKYPNKPNLYSQVSSYYHPFLTDSNQVGTLERYDKFSHHSKPSWQ